MAIFCMTCLGVTCVNTMAVVGIKSDSVGHGSLSKLILTRHGDTGISLWLHHIAHTPGFNTSALAFFYIVFILFY